MNQQNWVAFLTITRREIKRFGIRGNSIWPAQAISDGYAHVGRAELRHHRGVKVLHHGMDHALRMNHHLDLCGCHGKQKACLDHLQRLVHHGG